MLRWAIAVGLAVGLAVGATAGSAVAARPRAQPARSTATSAKAARKAGAPRAGANNLPPGFTWPPSRAMAAARAECERKLDATKVAWKRARPEGRIAAAVTIEDGMLGGIAYVSVYRKGPHKLDCQLALALHTIGPTLHAAGVREVHFGSIYRWSKVRVGGKTKRALSRHALGLAMDAVSFVDHSGREANVARDYQNGDALLLEIEQAFNAAGSFRIVLTPKNDPISHKDHFHIEASPSYAASAPSRRRGRP